MQTTISNATQDYPTNSSLTVSEVQTSYALNTTEPETYDLVDHFSYENVDQNYYDVDDGGTSVTGSDDQLDDVLKDACYVQTCRQIVTGRNLDYLRALHILQSEEYLSALTGEKAPLIEVDG